MCDIQCLDIHTAFHKHLDQPVQNTQSDTRSLQKSFTLLRHHELPPLCTGLSQLIPEQRILDTFGWIFLHIGLAYHNARTSTRQPKGYNTRLGSCVAEKGFQRFQTNVSS